MKNNDLKALCKVFNISLKDRYIYIPDSNINATVKKDNGITVITGVNKELCELLLNQNNAWLLDFCYGSLLDNYLYECKNGYMAFYETYLNNYSSCYTVYFSRDYKVCEKYYDDFDNDILETEELNNMSADEVIEKYL